MFLYSFYFNFILCVLPTYSAYQLKLMYVFWIVLLDSLLTIRRTLEKHILHYNRVISHATCHFFSHIMHIKLTPEIYWITSNTRNTSLVALFNGYSGSLNIKARTLPHLPNSSWTPTDLHHELQKGCYGIILENNCDVRGKTRNFKRCETNQQSNFKMDPLLISRWNRLFELRFLLTFQCWLSHKTT